MGRSNSISPVAGHDQIWISRLSEWTKGIKEPRQRLAKLIRMFQELTPDEISGIIQLIFQKATDRRSPLRRLHLDLVTHRSILRELGYETVSALYEHASREGWNEVRAFLRSDRGSKAEAEEIPEGYSVKLAALTVGEKKQLSKGNQRRMLELLLFESHPLVIRDLLRNPRISERDVVRIAARHQAPAPVLEEILSSDRWMAQYSVKKALVFNPNTPLPAALGLAQHLRDNDLRILLSGGTPRPELIAYARKRTRATD
ncbi:MAG TPA: hypothetical protein VI895_00035 [Bdellovibrionota bacterium]|nr:hypothetical protein [Bdellovibrionota bacterium]